MLLLAFDTATPAVTVALHDGTAAWFTAELAVDARRHGELLAPAIARVLATAGAAAGDLTGIAVGTGPGPYTGLRAGLVTARALGDALRLPVHGVYTMDIIAFEAAQPAGTFAGSQLHGGDRRPAQGGLLGPVHGRLAAGCTARRLAHPPTPPADGGPEVGRQGPLAVPGRATARHVATRPRYPSAAALAALVAGRLARGFRRAAPARGRCTCGARTPAYRGRRSGSRHEQAAIGSPRHDRADLDAVLELEDELFGEEAWTRQMLAGELAQQPASRHYLVADDGGGSPVMRCSGPAARATW